MSTQNVTLYFNPRCSKSRGALELLNEKGIEPTIVDYMKDPPDVETLQRIIDLLKVPVRDLIRTHEQVFKDAGMDDPDLPDDELIEAVSQCPTLLQRPIVVVDDQRAVIARPPEKLLDII
jgi:arsenate reductase